MYRFAPSPTGDMHIGNLRVALFNYICAKQSNEKFIIRMEDGDSEQNIDGKDQEILEILHLFSIHFDDVSYQSDNLKFHRQLGSKLLMDAHAFSCFCTPELLEEKNEQYDGTCKKLSNEAVLNNENPFTIRMKAPNTSITFHDLIQGEQAFEPQSIDDFVILKVDKTPTYNFACAIDDMLHNIGTIIRSEDYLADTPKQELIRQNLGFDQKITYIHLPTILNNFGKKIETEDESADVKWLLEEGFLPDTIINYLICTSTQTPTEIFTLQEAIEWFDIQKVSKEPAIFDLEKLRALNSTHIKMLDPMELSKYIGYSSRDIGELAKVYLEEARTINEIKAKIDTIFSTKQSEAFTKELEALKVVAHTIPYFKTFDEFKAYLGEKSELEDEQLNLLLPLLLTGTSSGPSLRTIYPHIKNYLGEIIK